MGEIMKRVLGIVSVLVFFPTAAFAQDSLCFMQWRGRIIDLTSSMCRSSTSDEMPTEEALPDVDSEEANAEEALPDADSDIRVSHVRIESTKDGSAVEVKGTLTNESGQVSSLSLVEFDVINERDGSVVTSDAAEVEAGGEIEPGEKIAFSKIIDKNTLGQEATIPDLRVEITGSVWCKKGSREQGKSALRSPYFTAPSSKGQRLRIGLNQLS